MKNTKMLFYINKFINNDRNIITIIIISEVGHK